MKKLTKANTNYAKNAAVTTAVRSFLGFENAINGTTDSRWVLGHAQFTTDAHGAISLIDWQAESERNNYGMTVWSDGDDTFVVPGFAVDNDNDWMGISTNGQNYEIVDGKPVVVEL